MTIASFLTPKHEVVWLPGLSTVRQALLRMEAHRHTAVPLLDDDGHYIGTLTEGDLLRRLWRTRADLEHELDTPLIEIERHMQNHPIHIDARIEVLVARAIVQGFVPVVDDREIFSGIVRPERVFEHCARQAGLLP